MKNSTVPTRTWTAVMLALGGAALLAAAALAVHAADDKKPAAAAPRPALSVGTTQPQVSSLPLTIAANGNIAAWQEAIIGTEANGLRLADVRVNVGDVVRKGQVLATFAPDLLQADVAQIRAVVAEAEAALAEAAANAARARELQTSGALSEQQINQFMTAERTAQARLEAQRAQANVQALRLRQTQVLAPDDGVISARSATVGAVLPAGQELFRMIRQGRLEWRADVASSDLARLKPGMSARVTPTGGAPIAGTLRMVAPTVDSATRNGIVFVDLAPSPGARAGMFASGVFDIGQGQGLTLPQSAVLLRDGFNYVLRVGPDSRVSEVKVTVGRRVGDRVEITGGLDTSARVVASGGGFLTDGDTVRVVDGAAQAAATPATTVKK
jgi:RND family efflux transporter MFP subunit